MAHNSGHPLARAVYSICGQFEARLPSDERSHRSRPVLYYICADRFEITRRRSAATSYCYIVPTILHATKHALERNAVPKIRHHTHSIHNCMATLENEKRVERVR